jgi:hypothetical protein
MKSFVIAALLGAVASVRLIDSPDCPESTQVFSYNERAPAAAGLIQTMSSCAISNVPGVTCIPDQHLFATGASGDEDLGMDITMKGNKFHIA